MSAGRNHVSSATIWIVIALMWVVAGIFLLTARKPLPKPQPLPASDVRPTPAPAVTPAAEHAVTAAELAAADGRSGHVCYTAVSGEVYLVPESSVWQDGTHIPAQGLVYCGQDETDNLARSPHGASVLSSLQKVGPLQ